MEKLDKIFEQQVLILSQLQIRSQTPPSIFENPTVNKIAPTPLPELIQAPGIQNFLREFSEECNPVSHLL
jgi:hypothetical protein